MDVVGCGLTVVDELMQMPDLPEEDGKITATALHRQVGGPVPTALAMLSRLGRTCGLISSWGTDPLGQFIGHDLEREGIDLLSCVVSTERETGIAHVWLNMATGTRTVASYRPKTPITAPRITPASLRDADCLYLDGWPAETALAAAKLARQQGMRVFLDAGSMRPGLEDVLPYVDVINASPRFCRDFCQSEEPDTAGSRIQEAGPRWVIMTSGSGPVVLHTRSHRIEEEPPRVQVVDSNGAGDVFCGAFVHGWLADWAADYTLRFATTAATLKCQMLGNRQALPSLHRIIDLAGPIPRDEEGEDV